MCGHWRQGRTSGPTTETIVRIGPDCSIITSRPAVPSVPRLKLP